MSRASRQMRAAIRQVKHEPLHDVEYTLPVCQFQAPYDGTWGSLCGGNWTPKTNEPCAAHRGDTSEFDWQRRVEDFAGIDDPDLVQWYRDERRGLWLMLTYPDAAAAMQYGFCTEVQALRNRFGLLAGHAVTNTNPKPLCQHPITQAVVYSDKDNADLADGDLGALSCFDFADGYVRPDCGRRSMGLVVS